jgi:membrane-bound ClpP family serine protease
MQPTQEQISQLALCFEVYSRKRSMIIAGGLLLLLLLLLVLLLNTKWAV